MNQANVQEMFDSQAQQIIVGFNDKMQALYTLIETQLKHAQEIQDREVAKHQGRFASLMKEVPEIPRDGHAFFGKIVEIVELQKALDSLERYPQERILAETIFISVFSSFDAYLYQLLHHLFLQKPRALNRPKPKEVSFAAVLDNTKEEIINLVIDKEVETLLRQSYVKLFDKLAERFDCGTLVKFPSWPVFVECSQRRNLMTHCDGVVSKQYLQICKSVSAKIDKSIVLGDRLSVTPEYLRNAHEVVTETGLKLGQVLWRASSQLSIDAADAQLGEMLFELLKQEKWTLTLKLGEFGKDLAKRSYTRPRRERAVKVILVNYAQAAKWSGDQAKSLEIINGFDWSGSALDFCLAVACIKGDWDAAAALMQQIGKNSKMVPAVAYSNWPIFREFRGTPEFGAMFKTVYGIEFTDTIKNEREEGTGDQATTPTDNQDEEKNNLSGE